MAHRLTELIARLVRREDLSRDEAEQLLESLLDAEATDAQIAAALVALAAKGETVEELTGMAAGLRSRVSRIEARPSCFIDTAGADLVTALGVNVAAIPSVSEKALDDIGICFMFAPLYHGATARVAGIRRQLGIHTTFNLLGPLSNPASAPRQIVGVWREDLAERLARVLVALGTEHAWVVHGEDGLDEVTLAGRTHVAEARDGDVRTFAIAPQDFGFAAGALDHLRGGDPEANAVIVRAVLEIGRASCRERV